MFLATKMGSKPRFHDLSMLSCLIEHEDLLPSFVSSRKALFRQAPVEICNFFGGPAGLLLEPLKINGESLDEASPTR